MIPLELGYGVGVGKDDELGFSGVEFEVSVGPPCRSQCPAGGWRRSLESWGLVWDLRGLGGSNSLGKHGMPGPGGELTGAQEGFVEVTNPDNGLERGEVSAGVVP